MKNHSQRRRLNPVSRAGRHALFAAALAASVATVRATPIYDVWNGANSSWSNGSMWSAGVPNNSGSFTYQAVIGQGVAALDIDATISDLYVYGSAEVGGSRTLNINNSFQWNGGYVGYVNATPTLNLAAGSTFVLETPPAAQGSPARLLWGTINTYGTTNYTGGGTLYVNGGASINNYGTFNLSAPGGISHSNGTGTLLNAAGATFNKTGTTSSTVDANFSNAGAVALSGGTLKLEAVTNNAGGTITAAAGTTLILDGSGANNYLAGSDLNGNGAISFTFGTHNFAAGAFHPTGAVTIAGSSTVNVKNTITPASLGTIAGTLNTDADQSFGDVTLAGHIGGAGTIAFRNNFAWTGGTLDRVSPTIPGHTAIAAGTQATFAAASPVTSTRIIDNAGTISHTGAILYLNNGGTLNNTGVFYASGTGGISTNFSPGYVNNSGAFDLIANVTYPVVVQFANTGAVNVDAGTLVLSGGGSNAGAINVLAGATVKFDSPMTHTAGSTLSGAGNLLFSFGTNDFTNTAVSTTGTLTLGANTTVTFGNVFTPSGTVNVAGTLVLNTTASSTGDQTYPDLTLTGTLGGSRNVTVSNHLDWATANSSNLTGTGHITIAAGATADVGGNTRTSTRVIDNFGTTSDLAASLYLNAGSAFNNAGTFNFGGGLTIANNNGVGAFNNSGTFNKAGTAASTISIPLNNAPTGTVNVNEGTLVLTGGNGSNAGTINVASGATLRFGATLSHAAGSSITGPGNLELNSGNNDLTNTAVSATGTFNVLANSTATLGNAITPSGAVTVAGTLVSNNTPASSGEQVFDQLNLTGTLSGSRDVRITGHLNWSGSSAIGGTGKLTLGSAVVADVDGTGKTITRPLDNYGTLNHTAGNFYVNVAGAVANYGTFNATSPAGISNNNGLGTLTNYGTFAKSGTSGYSIAIPFTNAATGVVNVDAGSLTLAGGSDAGRIKLAAGTTLTFGQTFTHGATSLISGAGGVAFTNGTHVFPAGTYAATGPVTFGTSANVTLNNTITPSTVGTIAGSVTFNADQSFADVTMAGNVGGTGNLTLSGAFNWSSGTMSGTGTTVLPAGATWSMTNSSGSRYISRPIDSSAAATFSAGTTYITGGATLTNRGTFDASATGFSAQSGGGTFANVGTFNKAGTSTFTFPSGLPFNNTGTVNVNQGVLTFAGGGTNSGTINVSPSGTLHFDAGLTYGPSSLLAGSGAVEFAGGTHAFPAGAYAATGPLTVGSQGVVTFNNAIAPSSLAPIAGTLNVNANQTFGNLTLANNGTLGGAGDFLVTGTFVYNGGTLAGSGKTDFQVGSTLDMTNSGTRSLSRKMNTGGIVNYSAGSVTFSGATWQLSSGINVTGSNFLNWSATGGTTNAVNNNAAITVNMAPAAEFSIGSGITLSSIGSVNVTSGKFTLGAIPVQLNAGGTLTAGTWSVGNAGNLNFVAGPNVTTVGTNAIVTLDGAGSKFDKLNAVTRNDGSLGFSGGRAFSTASAFNNTGFATVSSNAAWTTAALTNSGQINVTAGGTLTTNGLAISTGTLVIAVGSTMTVAGGLNQTGGSIVGEGTLNHTGGTSTISATTSQAWWDGSALNVTGGSLTLASDSGAIYPNPYLAVSVSGTGTFRSSSSTQRLKSLTVSTGGNAILNAGSTVSLFTRTLSLIGTGKLDLNDNRLLVDDLAEGSPTLSLFRQYLAAGSLFSSTANADPQHRMGIGYADASDLGVDYWGSQAVYYGGMTLAKVTWLGDANLDGKINADDYVLVDRGYARSVTNAHWTDGDFNYDGVVTLADYLLIDRVVLQQSGTLSPSLLAQREQQFGPTYVTELLTAVPEPTSACLLLLGSPLLGRRRVSRI